jgi:predicted TIM-barrel fold metal-dependent hydrolase
VIIDAHIHVGPWSHADFLGRTSDLTQTLAVMRDAGVDGAVVMPSDQRDNEALLTAMRREVDAGFRGPLWMFAWIGPAEAGNTAELDWVRGHRQEITGLKLHPSLSRIPVSADAFRPALELADELGLCVLVHCGRWTEVAGFAHAVSVAERYPRVRFLLAHAGGDTPPNAMGAARAVAERGLTNVWFEFSGLREYWVIEHNVRLLGAERYLLGSDFPLAHPLMYLGAVRGMSLSEEDKAKILGKNALALLGKAPLLSPRPV